MTLKLKDFQKALEAFIMEQEDPNRAREAEIDYIDFTGWEWHRVDIKYDKEKNVITIW